MATKREQILAQIATTLADTAGVGGRVYRSRTAALARAESPAIIVEPVTDACQQFTSLPKLDWTLRVRIVVTVRSDSVHTDADLVINSMHSKLMADLTLGGLSIDVQPSIVNFDFFDADKPAGVFSCEYEVLYRTAVADLTTE
jgi:hypothetical protein